MRGGTLKAQHNQQNGGNTANSQRQTNGIMAVASFASKAQQQMNINRPQTTGKMRVNYTSHGKKPASARKQWSAFYLGILVCVIYGTPL